MPNTCSICKHEDRAGIEDALARGLSLRSIAKQFSVGDSAVFRHQNCIIEALREAQKRLSLRTVQTVNDRLGSLFRDVDEMRDACREYLTDSATGKLTVLPRAEDITVVVQNGVLNQKRRLDEVLKEIDKAATCGKVKGYEINLSDPRKLYLEAVKILDSLVDRLAKLTGAYQKKQENEHDQRRNDERLIYSVILLTRLKGREITRDEAISEIEAERQSLALVAREANQLAEVWIAGNQLKG